MSFLSILLAAFLLQDHAAKAQTLTTIADEATGIQLGLPAEVLASRSSARWGTNWHYAGNTLNIDALNFGNRTLADLNGTLRSIRGRRVTNTSVTPFQLLLEGRDGDGTWFYITVHRQGEFSRGLSIVYSNASYEPLVRSIAASFVAFPALQPAPSSPTVSAPQPPPDGASERVTELARELERVKEQLRQQELERERQQAIETIRKEERERLEREFAQREKERLAVLSEERERAARVAKAVAEERQHTAQQLETDGDDPKAACANRGGVQSSAADC